MEISEKAQINKIGAEVCGEEDEVEVAVEVVAMVDLERKIRRWKINGWTCSKRKRI